MGWFLNYILKCEKVAFYLSSDFSIIKQPIGHQWKRLTRVRIITKSSPSPRFSKTYRCYKCSRCGNEMLIKKARFQNTRYRVYASIKYKEGCREKVMDDVCR